MAHTLRCAAVALRIENIPLPPPLPNQKPLHYMEPPLPPPPPDAAGDTYFGAVFSASSEATFSASAHSGAAADSGDHHPITII